MATEEQATEAGEWRRRARESWKAANLLYQQTIPLVMSATSRLYYSVYQGARAHVLEAQPGVDLPEKHGAFWNFLQGGTQPANLRELGALVADMYTWRRKADYAEDAITTNNVRYLLAKCMPTLQWLKVC